LHPCAANPCGSVDARIVFDGKKHHFVLCLASNTFDFLRPRPLTHTCVVFQMPPSSASVQTVVGYKCIAPGCDKMFDTRNSYNRHRAHRSHAGSACADIKNGRQLISRGPASGDRPKLFSMRIALAQQHGADSAYAAMQIITHHYAPLRSCVKSCWKATITQNLSTFALNYASLRSHSGGGVGPPLPSRMRNEFGCVKVRKNCVNNGFLRKLRKLRKRVNLEFLRNLCIFA